MDKSEVEFQRQPRSKFWSAWPDLTKRQAITLGWLSLMIMYWIAFFTGLKVDIMFAGTMFGFQGLDVVNKINKRKGK